MTMEDHDGSFATIFNQVYLTESDSCGFTV